MHAAGKVSDAFLEAIITVLFVDCVKALLL